MNVLIERSGERGSGSEDNDRRNRTNERRKRQKNVGEWRKKLSDYFCENEKKNERVLVLCYRMGGKRLRAGEARVRRGNSSLEEEIVRSVGLLIFLIRTATCLLLCDFATLTALSFVL